MVPGRLSRAYRIAGRDQLLGGGLPMVLHGLDPVPAKLRNRVEVCALWGIRLAAASVAKVPLGDFRSVILNHRRPTLAGPKPEESASRARGGASRAAVHNIRRIRRTW